MRRSVAWLVAFCLMLAGSQAAHVLAYRWVYPQSGLRVRELADTGHSYMDMLPLVLGVAAAVVVLSLLASGADAARGRTQRPLPAWAFGLLPLVGFAAQEHLERWLSSGVFPWHAVADPTFLPGLVLQLPFGFAAYLAARLLLRIAERVGRALAPDLPRTRPATLETAAPAREVEAPRSPLISRGLAKRGPPLPLGV